jgi:hypothetical protein
MEHKLLLSEHMGDSGSTTIGETTTIGSAFITRSNASAFHSALDARFFGSMRPTGTRSGYAFRADACAKAYGST